MSRTPDTQRPGVTDNPWQRLRAYTDARIGLGRAGISLPTQALLEFQLAHAQAQDAVHTPLDAEALQQQLAPLCTSHGIGAPLRVQSRAQDRATYLQRPDLGRRLEQRCADALSAVADQQAGVTDLAIAVVDGLSSRAIAENSLPFLQRLFTALAGERERWQLAAPVIVQQGRVAIGDEIGACLRARCVLVMVGERPGLSSPDSLGLYLTWAPRVGLTDAARNCISNVRPAGLSYDEAMRKLLYLLTESRHRQLSGVQLKERSDDAVIDGQGRTQNFLVSVPDRLTAPKR